MSSHYLFILSLIFPLPSTIDAQPSSCNGAGVVFVENRTSSTSSRRDVTEKDDDQVVSKLRSWKDQNLWHRRHPLTNVGGILNMIGWGTMLPIGTIVARSFSKFPLECEEWYNLHVVCQTLGYIVGAIGWGIGILMLGRNSSHQHKHNNLISIIIFTFSTLQMGALCLQPRREGEWHKWWKIYHKVMGYALIGMIIANIFRGIGGGGNYAEKWKWVYVGILVALAFVALSLQIFRWTKLLILHHRRLAFFF